MALDVFWHFVRLRMRERMEYRAAYVLGIVAQVWGYGASYLVIWLLLRRFESIAGWTWPEIAFLYSLELFAYAIGATFTYSQMTALEEMVTRGTFDGVLVRPLNPYLYLAARWFNMGYLAHIILSGSVLLWAVTQLPIQWTLLTLTYLGLIVASGALIQAAALTLIGTWSLAFVRSGFLFGLYYQMKSFTSYPISVYGAVIQVVLTGIVPLAFINFYPATVLLSKEGQLLPGWIGWLAPLVGPLFFGIAYMVWVRAVNRYQGAGG